MRRVPRFLALTALSTVALMGIGGQVTSAAPPDHAPASERARVVTYWTPDRVQNAIPRALSVDVVPTKKPTSPGGGNGGGQGGGNDDGGDGGSTTTVVGGAAWTGGGLVKATTGKVLFTLDSVDYVCSGSVVVDSNANASLVLTAGHCVYDDVGNAFATNWMFVPDYEDTATFDCDLARYGCWVATALVTTTAFGDGDINEDYAFAVVGPGGRTGDSLQLDATVGTQNIVFNVAHPTEVFAFGYPHASPYDGQDLTYCAGTDIADTWGYSTDYGLKCDMTGGSSGGPWFVNFTPATGTGDINSLNSFRYLRGPYSKYMFGPYFDTYTQVTYSVAQTASVNTLVAP